MPNNTTTTPELRKAFIKFQGLVKPIRKTKTVTMDKYQYTYAELCDIAEAIRGPLADCGLAYRQVTITEETRIGVQTILMHETGEMDCGVFFLPIRDINPQKWGSMLSFARRYSLQAGLCLSVTNEDLDAQDLVGEPNKTVEPTKTKDSDSSAKAQESPKKEMPRELPQAWKELVQQPTADLEVTRARKKFFVLTKNLSEDRTRDLVENFTGQRSRKLSLEQYNIINNFLESIINTKTG